MTLSSGQCRVFFKNASWRNVRSTEASGFLGLTITRYGAGGGGCTAETVVVKAGTPSAMISAAVVRALMGWPQKCAVVFTKNAAQYRSAVEMSGGLIRSGLSSPAVPAM